MTNMSIVINMNIFLDSSIYFDFQVKASISHLQEHQRQMRDAIALSESAISSGDSSSVPDTCLNLQPEFREPSYTRLTYNNEVKVYKVTCNTFFSLHFTNNVYRLSNKFLENVFKINQC